MFAPGCLGKDHRRIEGWGALLKSVPEDINNKGSFYGVSDELKT